MNAPNESTRGWHRVLDYTPFPDLARGQWLSQQPGIYRFVPPWVYRHPRFFGIGHIAGGAIQAAAGLICLAYGVPGWAAFFLAIAALNFAGGYWYLSIDRSSSDDSASATA